MMVSGGHKWWISGSLSWRGDVFRIFGFYEPVKAWFRTSNFHWHAHLLQIGPFCLPNFNCFMKQSPTTLYFSRWHAFGRSLCSFPLLPRALGSWSSGLFSLNGLDSMHACISCCFNHPPTWGHPLSHSHPFLFLHIKLSALVLILQSK